MLEKMYLSGQVGLELTPQGTLVERIRAAGAGIPGFYTPTGLGTPVQFGDVPMRYDTVGKVSWGSVMRRVLRAFKAVAFPKAREVRQFNGRSYVLEEAIKGDVAFIRAWKVDEAGNAIFRYTANNFSSAMARSAAVTIVEVCNLLHLVADSHLAGGGDCPGGPLGSKRGSSPRDIRRSRGQSYN